jgi:hypothetical protein
MTIWRLCGGATVYRNGLAQPFAACAQRRGSLKKHSQPQLAFTVPTSAASNEASEIRP